MAGAKVRQRKPGKEVAGNVSADRKEKGSESSSKTSKGCCHYLITGLLACTVLFATLLFVLPNEIEPVEVIRLSPPPQLIGPLSPDVISSRIVLLYEGEIKGPESLVVDGDHIYTGSADGWVKDLYKGEIRNIVKFGKGPCDENKVGASCGRPLGIRLEKKGSFIVCDADLGVFRVNIKTGDYEKLYDLSTPVNGKPSVFLNDIDVGLDGSVYFTETSSKWTRHQLFNIILEGSGSGRLMKYSPKTYETEEIMDDLFFANGVQITHDHSAILVAELGKARVMKYDLKTKTKSVWVDNLPGLPDNIRYSKETGTYWIAFGTLRTDEKFSLFDFVAPRPWLRGILRKIVKYGRLEGFLYQPKQPSMAVELDKSGNIIRTLYDKEGRMGAISEIHVSDGFAYFGSPSSSHLAKLRL